MLIVTSSLIHAKDDSVAAHLGDVASVVLAELEEVVVEDEGVDDLPIALLYLCAILDVLKLVHIELPDHLPQRDEDALRQPLEPPHPLLQGSPGLR